MLKPCLFDSYRLEPDFKGPLFQLSKKGKESLRDDLVSLYGVEIADRWFPELERIIAVNYAHKTEEMIKWDADFSANERFTEKDTILITYGDLVTEKDLKPIQTLRDLCSKYLKGVFSIIHLLPFFPSSSDRGFAIRDFRQVDPNLGTWNDILELKHDFKLMFDGVVNHVSSKSFWFREFLNGNEDYKDYFTVFSTEEDIPRDKLKMLFRPRTSDVLSQFYSYSGELMVWTTFSPDQIDLNFKNPKVLIRIIEILLYYIRRGADIIRLDAVTYLWDEVGTTGVHMDQTHTIIKMFRKILNAVAPHVAIITETNVPHKENISYFGNGIDEAQLVYNFALPPLILHTFQTGDSTRLSDWASSLENPSETATYFNFLDSHDGIGVMGARGILSDEEINAMAERAKEHGGLVSYRSEVDGKDSVYEINITSYSALNKEDSSEEQALQVKRYLSARSIPLVLIGVPGVYLHGLLGSRNDIEAVLADNDKRSINRDILEKEELVKAIRDENSTTSQVARGLIFLIRKRINEASFNPWAKQEVLNAGNEVFLLLRTAPGGKEKILVIVNISNKEMKLSVDVSSYVIGQGTWNDVLSGTSYKVDNNVLSIQMDSYDVLWLKTVRWER